MYARQRFVLYLVICVFLFAHLTFIDFSAADVTYLGLDDKTQGDWIGVYGADGAIIFCNQANHNATFPIPYEPSEDEKKVKKGLIEEIIATDLTQGTAYGWIWNANPPDDEKKSPWLVDESARFGACVAGSSWVDLAINLKVNSTRYQVAVYCLDYDVVRVPGQEIYGYQGEGLDDLPGQPDDEMGDHSQGVYALWEVTGNDPFNYFATKLVGTTNIVVSGIFIDETQAVEPDGKLANTWGDIKNLGMAME